MIPLDNLPKDVAEYLRRELAQLDTSQLRAAVPDLCARCPAKGPAAAPIGADEQVAPPCYSCPFWSFQMGLFDLEHWQP